MVNELNPDSQCSYGGDATVGAEISTALNNKGNSTVQREDDNLNSIGTARYPAAMNAELAEAIAKVISDGAGVCNDQLSASADDTKEVQKRRGT